MKKASNRVVAIFGCTKGEEVCPLMPFGVKNVWQQKGFMHPSFSHAFALLEEAAHVFGRGMSSKSCNHKAFTHLHAFCIKYIHTRNHPNFKQAYPSGLWSKFEDSWFIGNLRMSSFQGMYFHCILDHPFKSYGPRSGDCLKLACILMSDFVGITWPAKWTPI